MDIGGKITKIREEHSLTQDGLAERLHVTRQAVSKWERGVSYPSLDVLRLISAEFGMSLDRLLGTKGEEDSGEYKPLGYRHYGFAVLYSLMLLLFVLVTVFLDLSLAGTNAGLWESVVANLFLGSVLLSAAYLLLRSVLPAGRVLLEYRASGIRIRTRKGRAEIPFAEISSIEVRTHGSWSSGRLVVRTAGKDYSVYPLKDVNRVKTVLDEVKALSA